MSEKIYLVDGSALIFRAHYALVRNPLMTSEGVNVSAVFGFAQTLFSILQGEKAAYAAVAFDTGVNHSAIQSGSNTDAPRVVQGCNAVSQSCQMGLSHAGQSAGFDQGLSAGSISHHRFSVKNAITEIQAAGETDDLGLIGV